MEHGVADVAVANTFTRRLEMEPYYVAAKSLGYFVVEINLFTGGLTVAELSARNVHGVPMDVIQAMLDRYE